MDFTYTGAAFQEQVFKLLDTGTQVLNHSIQTRDLGITLGQLSFQLLDPQNECLLLFHQTALASKLSLQITDLVLQAFSGMWSRCVPKPSTQFTCPPPPK